MCCRLVLVTLLFASFIARFHVHLSFAQVPENEPPPVIESPPPSSESSPVPVPMDEHRLPELVPHERADAVMVLSELRSARSLRKAIVLREVLGAPVGLR